MQPSTDSSPLLRSFDIFKVFSKLFNAIYCSKKEKRRDAGGGEAQPAQPPEDTVAPAPSPVTRWFAAVQDQKLDDAKLALSDDALHVDVQDSSGWAAIHISAWNGYLDLLQFLLSQGAEINLPGPGGCTPVALAAQRGHAHLVSILISANCDVTKTANLSGNFNVAPLHLAAQHGHAEAVRLLIDAGASVNAGMVCSNSNIKGVTPLHLAVQAEHLDIMDILLAAGGDVHSSTQSNAETSC